MRWETQTITQMAMPHGREAIAEEAPARETRHDPFRAHFDATRELKRRDRPLRHSARLEVSRRTVRSWTVRESRAIEASEGERRLASASSRCGNASASWVARSIRSTTDTSSRLRRRVVALGLDQGRFRPGRGPVAEGATGRDRRGRTDSRWSRRRRRTTRRSRCPASTSIGRDRPTRWTPSVDRSRASGRRPVLHHRRRRDPRDPDVEEPGGGPRAGDVRRRDAAGLRPGEARPVRRRWPGRGARDPGARDLVHRHPAAGRRGPSDPVPGPGAVASYITEHGLYAA